MSIKISLYGGDQARIVQQRSLFMVCERQRQAMHGAFSDGQHEASRLIAVKQAGQHMHVSGFSRESCGGFAAFSESCRTLTGNETSQISERRYSCAISGIHFPGGLPAPARKRGRTGSAPDSRSSVAAGSARPTVFLQGRRGTGILTGCLAGRVRTGLGGLPRFGGSVRWLRRVRGSVLCCAHAGLPLACRRMS